MIYYKAIETGNGLAFLEDNWDPCYAAKTESVFAQCNGRIGVRAAVEGKTLEGSRGTFLAGLYHKASPSEVTELINCPDVTEMELILNGEAVYPDRCEVKSFQRILHLQDGELEIRMELKTRRGQELKIHTRRFASREDRHLFVHEAEFSARDGGAFSVTTGINGQITNSGAAHFDKTEARVFDKKWMFTQSECDDGQKLYLFSGIACSGEKKKSTFVLKRKSIYETREYDMKPDCPLTLTKVSYFRTGEERDGLSVEEMKEQADTALFQGYEKLKKAHDERWEELWKHARIRIEGASLEEQAAVDFAVYHVYGMTPDDTEQYSIAAKGLTGEGYKGHVFWDAELFVMPFLTAVFPKAAGNLLKYRYKGLSGARKKAVSYGYQGAMYPWEAAKTGEEETPLYAALNIHTGKAEKVWSGIKEHHVTADIIYALWDYYKVTGDQEFLSRCGLEMILEAALFWVSRSSYSEEKDRFEILDIIGPDEYTEHVDNNAYSNYMAWETVALAERLLERMDREDLEEEERKRYEELKARYDFAALQANFKRFLQKLYLPKPNAEGVIPQDDTFLDKPELPDIEKYRSSKIKQAILRDYSREEVVNMQVLKQADVVMLLNLLPERFTPEVIGKNVRFYEARSVHDSSLSYCAHAVASARIGEKEAADAFFRQALEIDLNENEKDSTDGIHSASLGGILNCLIQGYAGVEHKEEGLSLNPHLPDRWRSLSFWHFWGGNYYHITISKDRVEIRPEREGFCQSFEVDGVSYPVRENTVIMRKESKVL